MEGRLTRDVTLTTLPNSDRQVAKTTLAVRRNRKNNAGEYLSDFFPIVAWGKLALLLNKYTSKGSRLTVSGRLQSRSYELNGQTHYITEIYADEMSLADKVQEKPDVSDVAQSSPPQEDDPFSGSPSMEIQEDDLPF